MAKTLFTTHKGTAVYPYVNKPDTFGQGDPKYKVGIRVPVEQMKELKDLCMEVAKNDFGEKKAKTARMPFKQTDDDAEANMIIINAKSQFQPKVYDSTGTYIPADRLPQIWGGSILKMGGVINTYDLSGNTGVSLLLTKVQIVELVEGNGGDDGGFEIEEGGWTATEGTLSDAAEEQAESSEEEQEEKGFAANF